MVVQGGILGGVAYQNDNLTAEITQLLTLAQERGLDVDLHVDENGDRHSQVLHRVGDIALKIGFTGQITCGHCCSLALQSPEQVAKTLAVVKQAAMAIVSLPMCNLYLQGRRRGQTPLWRGITDVHSIKEEAIPLIFASDNCRDPFFPFGDHDALEVLNQAIRIAQLDPPYGAWGATVTKTPAAIMGLGQQGYLGQNNPADFVIFSARYFSELFSRSQGDRLVIRHGQTIDATPPDYRELDDLLAIEQTIRP
jgi:cytosine deaminase